MENNGIKPSVKCKDKGFTLKEMAEYYGKEPKFYRRWNKNMPKVFDALVTEYARVKEDQLRGQGV